MKHNLNDIKIGKLVYSGGYGNIYECVFNNRNMLIKQCKIIKGNINEIYFNKLLMKNRYKHSNLLLVPYNCGLTNEIYYIIMEKFNKFCKENCYKTVLCLKHLHNMGFVHGDIKFTNFIQNNSNVKLIDFGMTYKINFEKNKPYGTPLYMSINSHNGIIKPQNDFESLLYSLLDLYGNLPWYKFCYNSTKDCNEVLYEKIKFKESILKKDFSVINSFKLNYNFDLLKFAHMVYNNNINYFQLSKLLLFLKIK